MKVALPLPVFLLLLACQAKPTLASSVLTGIDLRDRCRWSQPVQTALTANQEIASATCLAYVIGVADGYHIAGGELCTPEAKIQEIVDVVYKYLQDHPEELHLDGDVLIINAMRHAWPCE